MLNLKSKKIIITTWLCISAFLSFNSCQVKHTTPLKVLVITGGHKYDKVEFNTMIDSLENLECTIIETGKDPGTLFEITDNFPYDAIMMYNFKQTLSVKHQENFKILLGKGVGLTIIHHALCGFPDWHEYEDIIGATYVAEEQTRDGVHIPSPIWKHDLDILIKVEDSKHPITKGITDFTVHDEAYKGWIYHDGNHLLLSSENKHSNHQIAWTRLYNDSRVFCIQLGHDKFSYENKNYHKLLKQGIEWTVRRKN